MSFHQHSEPFEPRVTLTGHPVVDAQMTKVGTVTDVLSDERSTPKWAIVKTGVIGGERFVPLDHSYLDRNGRLVVPLSKADIKRAPRVRGDHVLTTEVQRELRDFYGLAA